MEIALQLAKNGKLDLNLTAKIFSVEFLDKIDQEIDYLSRSGNEIGKTLWYPRKLRSSLMNLNRLVCICFPEYNVPWFHEKYCLENIQYIKSAAFFDHTLEPVKEDVYHTLCTLAGGYRNVRENVYSPYFHFIDFELWLDNSDQMEDVERKFPHVTNFLPIGNV